MDLQYKQEVEKYGKKDGIIALCYFAYLVIVVILGTILRDHFGGWNIFQQLFIAIVIHTLPCIVIVLLKKQGLRSLGFRKEKLQQNLLYGVFVGLVPFLVYFVLVHFVLGFEFRAMSFIAYNFVLTFTLAVREDIVFVGFIQTRIYGLIENDKLAVIVGAAIFSFIHVPMLIMGGAQYDMMSIVSMVVQWFLVHILLLNAVYRYSVSIFPVIMLHIFFNMSINVTHYAHIWESQIPWPFYVQIVLTLAAVHIVGKYLSRRNKKAAEGIDR